MRKSNSAEGTTREAVKTFKATEPLLAAMLEELRKFASKKPEAAVSKQKIAIVNRLLTDLKALLADAPNIKYLDLLTEDDVPQYSDVVLILSQYEAAMKAFRVRYCKWELHEHVWVLHGGEKMKDNDVD